MYEAMARSDHFLSASNSEFKGKGLRDKVVQPMLGLDSSLRPIRAPLLNETKTCNVAKCECLHEVTLCLFSWRLHADRASGLLKFCCTSVMHFSELLL